MTGADTLNGVDGVSVATSYSYDANGSTLTVTTGDGGVTTNEWDLEGRLVHVAQPGGHAIDYSYNESGDRTSETDDGTKTTFLNDPNNAYDQVLEEYVAEKVPRTVLVSLRHSGLAEGLKRGIASWSATSVIPEAASPILGVTAPGILSPGIFAERRREAFR